MVTQTPKHPSLAEGVTARQASKVCGLSVHMINYLCLRKVVNPTAKNGRGRGHVRRFVFSDLLMLKLAAKLLKHGISVKRLSAALASLYRKRILPNAALESSYVVTDGVALYFKRNGIVEELESGQLAFAFVLELNSLRSEVTRAINRLAA